MATMPELFPIAPPPEGDSDVKRPLWVRLAWFAGLAVASGTVVAITAYALRAVLFV